jgi:hypothetical protein
MTSPARGKMWLIAAAAKVDPEFHFAVTVVFGRCGI